VPLHLARYAGPASCRVESIYHQSRRAQPHLPFAGKILLQWKYTLVFLTKPEAASLNFACTASSELSLEATLLPGHSGAGRRFLD